jgi:hypothetical protein
MENLKDNMESLKDNNIQPKVKLMLLNTNQLKTKS